MSEKTVLFESHEQLGGKIVDFAGFLLPINYLKGIIYEHKLVRSDVGIFDVSHMGEILVSGERAREYLDRMMTNNIGNLAVGKVRYSVMCYSDGGCVDDLLVYCLAKDSYLLVVNAINKAKDLAHLIEYQWDDLEITDKSADYSQLAIQGPNSGKILERYFKELPLKYFSFIMIDDCIVSQTGYTGEYGFEIYGSGDKIKKIWNELLCLGVEACGLGCRDTLRFEAGLPLYGHEISEVINPIDGGLAFAVKLTKEFFGKQAIEVVVEPRQMIGLELIDRGIARSGHLVYQNNILVGVVTSGMYSPTMDKSLASVLVNSTYNQEQDCIIMVREKGLKAQRVAMPYYQRENKDQ